MSVETFDEKMQRVQARLQDMLGAGRLTALTWTSENAEALEELAVALEELHAADAELRGRNQDLARIYRRYEELFEFAPDAYLVTDASGSIREANRAATLLIGIDADKLKGKPLLLSIAAEQRREFRKWFFELKAGQSFFDRDLLIQPRQDSVVPCACSVLAVVDPDGVVNYFLWLIRDISERHASHKLLQQTLEQERAAQAALRASEERFRMVLKYLPLTVFNLDRALRYTWVYNPLGGRRAEEMIGKTDAELGVMQSPDHITQVQRGVLDTGTGRQTPMTVVDDTGTHYYDVTLEPLRDAEGQIVGLTGAAMDVTAWQQEQHRIRVKNVKLDAMINARTQELQIANEQLRALTRQIVMVQEEERRRISRELHDEIGQELTALQLVLNAMRENLPGTDKPNAVRLNDALEVLRELSQQITALAHDLRPAALDTVDFASALEGFCREFSRRAKIAVQYAGTVAIVLRPAEKITLYRVLQESLNNIAKHARASNVRVELRQENRTIRLVVEDDGVGFDSERQFTARSPQGGLGLIGMQERLHSIGGALLVRSRKNQGTQIIASVPTQGVE